MRDSDDTTHSNVSAPVERRSGRGAVLGRGGVAGAALVAASLTFAGCGDDTDARDPDVGVDTEAEALRALCNAQAQLRCRRETTCGCPNTSGTEASCTQAFRTLCEGRIRADVEARQRTELVLDAARMASCTEALAAQADDCSEPRMGAVEAACAPLVAAVAAIGEPCDALGRFCADGAGLCAPSGACVAMPDAGADCFPEGPFPRCRAGLTCVGGTCAPPVAVGGACDGDVCVAEARCADGRCRRPVALGEACGDDAACEGASTCEGGRCVEATAAFCDAPGAACGDDGLCGGAVDRRCVPVPGRGGACEASESCQAGLACVDGICVDGPAQGQPCVDGLWCGPGLACSMDGVCGPVPTRGEPCAMGLFGPFTCAEGLACVARRCADVPGEGEECGGQARCAEGLGCAFEGDVSRCRARRPAGEPCDNDTICDAGTHCDFGAGRCRANFALGASCIAGNECGADGSCIEDGRGGFACVRTPDEGDACLFECREGLVCDAARGDLSCFASVCASFER